MSDAKPTGTRHGRVEISFKYSITVPGFGDSVHRWSGEATRQYDDDGPFYLHVKGPAVIVPYHNIASYRWLPEPEE